MSASVKAMIPGHEISMTLRAQDVVRVNDVRCKSFMGEEFRCDMALGADCVKSCNTCRDAVPEVRPKEASIFEQRQRALKLAAIRTLVFGPGGPKEAA